MVELDYTKENIQILLDFATKKGNEAGDEWMANATPKFEVFDADIMTGKLRGPSRGIMLDVCGNAHIKIKDKRTKFYKAIIKFNFFPREYLSVIPIYHKYQHRQEHGLAVAITCAAMKVLTDNGVKGITLWEYID